MILATNNKGKLREIKEILCDYEIKGLNESNIDIDVVEDQNTFYGNASKKANEIYDLVKQPVIADDSGLCINILDNWPGVNTHRFLGENKTDRERNIAIIDKMKNYSNQSDRKASVICNLVYYDGINEVVGIGEIKGYISNQIKGVNGFGFDEIFLLESGKTLAELSSEEKNQVSARYLATIDLKNKIDLLKR